MLDVGAGRGEFTSGLQAALGVKEVFGVDGSPDAVAASLEGGIHASVVNLNLDRLPFDQCEFDLVTMIETIEHLEDVEHCLTEVARVTRPAGCLLVTTPNLASWHGRLSLLLGFQPFTLDVGFRHHYGSLVRFSGKSAGHIRGFTIPALRELASECGFRLVKLSSCAVSFETGTAASRAMHLLDRTLSMSSAWGSDLIALFHKSTGD